jgi:hypothetical protein
MPWPIVLVLLCLSLSARAEEVEVCYNYGCAVRARVTFDERQLRGVAKLFARIGDGAAERSAIGQAVGMLGAAAGEQTPIRADKGGNAEDDGVDGRMDCIDHSTNTTAYLRLLEGRGWLKYHRVLEPVRRAPLLVDDHWAARIVEIGSGREFVVDSWFFDNGHPAAIFPLEDWRNGARPDE